ncbi:MAG: hypothetical protein JNL98_17965 [Bryobacterales bacterium]|nr:hypothetical protein [Bryobacterales bacterium]
MKRTEPEIRPMPAMPVPRAQVRRKPPRPAAFARGRVDPKSGQAQFTKEWKKPVRPVLEMLASRVRQIPYP